MNRSIDFFGSVYGICMDDRSQHQARLLESLNDVYPGFQPKIFPAINTRNNPNHYVGCTLSHRAVVEAAADANYDSVLVFEEDARLHKDFSRVMQLATTELANFHWDVLYLGACVWEKTYPKAVAGNAAPCKNLERVHGATCSHALAYHSRFYDEILALPTTRQGMTDWCETHLCIDQWLMHAQRKRNAFIVAPRIATQPFLMGTHPNGKPKQDHGDHWI